jgi:hypothetical protein
MGCLKMGRMLHWYETNSYAVWTLHLETNQSKKDEHLMTYPGPHMAKPMRSNGS